jgi:hypothetical protein
MYPLKALFMPLNSLKSIREFIVFELFGESFLAPTYSRGCYKKYLIDNVDYKAYTISESRDK